MIVGAAPLSKVRVFYDGGGRFLAKNIYVGALDPSIAPTWSIGYCDILSTDWVEANATGGRKKLNSSNCSFYTPAKNSEELRLDELKALAVKMGDGTIDAIEKDRLMVLLLKDLRYLD